MDGGAFFSLNEFLRLFRGVLFLIAASAGLSASALAACKMSKMAELPVTMLGLRPLIDAKINDKDVRFEVGGLNRSRGRGGFVSGPRGS
jgi:hypothetical protein